MRRHSSLLVCFAVIVVSVSDVAAQSMRPLDGKWEGTIAQKRATGSRTARQSAQTLVAFAISAAGDGTYGGKWLDTSVKRTGETADIGKVTIDGDAVRIDVPSHGVWEGKLSSDGLTLAGEWRQGSKTTPLVLRRTGNATEPVSVNMRGTTSRR
jgi:hypothetical protein